MNFIKKGLVLILLSILSSNVFAVNEVFQSNNVDFIHYKAELSPNIQASSVAGKVDIEFVPNDAKTNKLTFSAMYKTISSVAINTSSVNYTIKDKLLEVIFNQPLLAGKSYVLTVEYQASPKKGMKFYDDNMFTVYHTKNWLVAHDDIADKASFELLLTHDASLMSVGNGKLISSQQSISGDVVSHWLQEDSIPIYSFGFALGEFKQISETYKNLTLSYLYRKEEKSGLTAELVKEIFINVTDMISFFEQKAGFSLSANGYKYVLVPGYMAQEATSFSLVGEKYAHTVLKDKNENWFIAHELAHEWWGNSITCQNFSDFWLNEGLVQFLVAAYKQSLFGEIAYKNEIGLAMDRVNKAVAEGRTSPVAFKYRTQEGDINRTMVYSKGAIIFHMLRKMLGEEIFWLALRDYSINNQQNSVTTEDLKNAFEKTSKQDLTDFFERWVYGNEIPNLKLLAI